MCGIGGILFGRVGVEDAADRAHRMRRVLRPRGPDAEGFEELHCGVLVHTRLAVQDLTAAGSQPMGRGRWRIVFNGEVYNFRSLRRELERTGVRFESESDTEVVLRIFESEGVAGLRRLRGMYAFAALEVETGRGYLVRDPLGIKPLYYAVARGSLVFASEIKAVMASGLVEPRADPDGVCGFFLSGSVPEPSTLVEGVRMLRAGHWLKWECGRVEEASHWRLEVEEADVGWGGAVERARSALGETVERHLVSDVQPGLFLSGGLDSAAVLAMVNGLGGRGMRTFSIRFVEEGYDEGGLAAMSAQRFGAEHAEWELSAAEALELFAEYLTAMDQPTIDGFNTFVVSRFARQSGVKVVLSGIGGDEVFGGYPSFRWVPFLVRSGLWARRSAGLGRWLGGQLRQRGGGRWARQGEFLCGKPSLERAYGAFRGIFLQSEALEWTRRLCGGRLGAVFGDDAWMLERPVGVEDVCRMEVERYLRNQLLRDSDVFSMASGVELRTPLVDRTFMEALAAVPARWRFASKKKLLQAAVPEIPEAVLKGGKRGFSFPYAAWLKREWSGVFVESEKYWSGLGFGNISRRSWFQRWALAVLREKMNGLGVAPELVSLSGSTPLISP
jgi:asparagine synthase (glutamine-hydrolysing)